MRVEFGRGAEAQQRLFDALRQPKSTAGLAARETAAFGERDLHRGFSLPSSSEGKSVAYTATDIS